MDNISLVRKYVRKESCGHCGGTGKCKCDRCKSNRHSTAMSLWSITHRRPLPYEVEARDEHNKAYWEESKRLEKEIAGHNTCFQCGGKGTVEKCDYERLEQEVRDGQIMESEKYAILKELGRLLPSFAFEPNE